MTGIAAVPEVPPCPDGWEIATPGVMTGELVRWRHRSDAGTVTLVLLHTDAGPQVAVAGGPGLHIPTFGVDRLDTFARVHDGIGAAWEWLAACYYAAAQVVSDDTEQPMLWEAETQPPDSV